MFVCVKERQLLQLDHLNSSFYILPYYVKKEKVSGRDESYLLGDISISLHPPFGICHLKLIVHCTVFYSQDLSNSYGYVFHLCSSKK